MLCDDQTLFHWCEEQFPAQLSLLKTLAAIPSPSHREELRARFIHQWLHDHGAENAYIDDAENVVLPFGDGPYLAVLAHTDVVFPDTTPLSVREENGRLYAPGVGDDTANVVALMLCADYFLTHPNRLPRPMLLVWNSCEEGLGNLKGVRNIMADYQDRIRELVSFDLGFDWLVDRAVGSHRWEVTVSTQGGHSYGDFGRPNAIAHLSRLIDRLYGQPLPEIPGTKTTFNVGTISGGTSVNTIAQNAAMTYEYRSDDFDCLAYMQSQFEALVQEFQEPDVVFAAENLGQRPCGNHVPEDEHEALLSRCTDAIVRITGTAPRRCAASTDANIPLSLGIPAATFGLYQGSGAHTRQEYVQIDSLTAGLKIALTFLLS